MATQSVNSMPAAWCAARVAEARAWRDANSQQTPGWQHVHELLSQIDAPPAPATAVAPEAQGLGAGEEPFDAEAFNRRFDATTAERRKSFGRKPGGDTNYSVAVARFMVGCNNPKHEPYLTQIEALVNAYDEVAARLATLEAAGAAGADADRLLAAVVAGRDSATTTIARCASMLADVIAEQDGSAGWQGEDEASPCYRIWRAMTDYLVKGLVPATTATVAPAPQQQAEAGRVDCPNCGEGLAWDATWAHTGNVCKVCGYDGWPDL